MRESKQYEQGQASINHIFSPSQQTHSLKIKNQNSNHLGHFSKMRNFYGKSLLLRLPTLEIGSLFGFDSAEKFNLSPSRQIVSLVMFISYSYCDHTIRLAHNILAKTRLHWISLTCVQAGLKRSPSKTNPNSLTSN